MVGLGGHHVPTLARERVARLSSGPAASITDTLTHPTITNETSPHYAEALCPGERASWTVPLQASADT
jgi:hypothetical protein